VFLVAFLEQPFEFHDAGCCAMLSASSTIEAR
jgi:hypothetical protein